VLHYIYTDNIQECLREDVNLCVEVLMAANQLGMTRLRQLCESALANFITLDTIPVLFEVRQATHCVTRYCESDTLVFIATAIRSSQVADVHEASELKNACFQALLRNIRSALELDIFDGSVQDLLLQFQRDIDSRFEALKRSSNQNSPTMHSRDLVRLMMQVLEEAGEGVRANEPPILTPFEEAKKRVRTLRKKLQQLQRIQVAIDEVGTHVLLRLNCTKRRRLTQSRCTPGPRGEQLRVEQVRRPPVVGSRARIDHKRVFLVVDSRLGRSTPGARATTKHDRFDE